MPNNIGGEFAIAPESINHNCMIHFESDEYLYVSGRGALYNILLNIKKNHSKINKILLPNYLCYSVIDVVYKAEFEFAFYNIDWTFIPDQRQIIELYTDKAGLLLVNYFGITNLDPLITEIRQAIPDICIILDNVQALFEMRRMQEVNYSFTSFRKWLPVPDGAIVKTGEAGMKAPTEKNISSQWKFAGALLKAYRFFSEIEDEVYLELLKKGEFFLQKGYNYKCSAICLSILNTLNYDNIKKQRLENANFLINTLSNIDVSFLPWQTESLKSTMVPLFIPMRSKKRDQIKEKLASNNIFCPVHWPPPPPPCVQEYQIIFIMKNCP
jgi:dTDP-4-amino-4,6-dideoxygalactose transaminase